MYGIRRLSQRKEPVHAQNGLREVMGQVEISDRVQIIKGYIGKSHFGDFQAQIYQAQLHFSQFR